MDKDQEYNPDQENACPDTPSPHTPSSHDAVDPRTPGHDVTHRIGHPIPTPDLEPIPFIMAPIQEDTPTRDGHTDPAKLQFVLQGAAPEDQPVIKQYVDEYQHALATEVVIHRPTTDINCCSLLLASFCVAVIAGVVKMYAEPYDDFGSH